MLFQDRRHAAHLLAAGLADFRGKAPLILGIPRGGVVMASVLAEELLGDLDVILVQKLRAPGLPEVAIGAVFESGRIVLGHPGFGREVDPHYLEREADRAVTLLRERRQRYTPHRTPADPRGRAVIVVDDGIATGATMLAALEALSEAGAERRAVAVAVAPEGVANALAFAADEVVCLATPEDFAAVSQFFVDFSPVSDEEVIAVLEGHAGRRAA